MATTNLIITNAGLAAIAGLSGTEKVTITEIACGYVSKGISLGVSYTAEQIREILADSTSMNGEIKRLPVITQSIDAETNVLHLTCSDTSYDAYTCNELGVYTSEGILFAYATQFYGGATVGSELFQKAEKSHALLAIDLALTNVNPDSITVGDTNFQFEDATEERKGILELATQEEAKAGTDTKRAITPKTLDAVIKTHSDVVHRSGAETIAGNKTFTGSFVISKDSPFILVSQNDVVKGTKPPTSQYMGLAFVDSEGHGTTNRLGIVETKYMADGGICLSLSAYKPENGSTASAGIEIIYPITGSPYINVPAPAAGDSSNKIATTAWVKAVADKLLPLAGGILAGVIKRAGVFATGTTAEAVLSIHGGTDSTDGSGVWLYGKDNANAGKFIIRASNGTKSVDLVGYPDGSLFWNGKNVIRSVNGTAADAAGNVVIKLEFLPLTGGEITGPIKGNANGALMLFTGDNNFDGASLQLYKNDHPTYPGRFYLRASTKSSGTDANGNEKTLVGFADGSLTWDGKNVMRSSNAQEIKVVDALPTNPDANTLYFVSGE